jgi:hypothetical protein
MALATILVVLQVLAVGASQAQNYDRVQDTKFDPTGRLRNMPCSSTTDGCSIAEAKQVCADNLPCTGFWCQRLNSEEQKRVIEFVTSASDRTPKAGFDTYNQSRVAPPSATTTVFTFNVSFASSVIVPTSGRFDPQIPGFQKKLRDMWNAALQPVTAPIQEVTVKEWYPSTDSAGGVLSMSLVAARSGADSVWASVSEINPLVCTVCAKVLISDASYGFPLDLSDSSLKSKATECPHCFVCDPQFQGKPKPFDLRCGKFMQPPRGFCPDTVPWNGNTCVCDVEWTGLSCDEQKHPPADTESLHLAWMAAGLVGSVLSVALGVYSIRKHLISRVRHRYAKAANRQIRDNAREGASIAVQPGNKESYDCLDRLVMRCCCLVTASGISTARPDKPAAATDPLVRHSQGKLPGGSFHHAATNDRQRERSVYYSATAGPD